MQDRLPGDVIGVLPLLVRVEALVVDHFHVGLLSVVQAPVVSVLSQAAVLWGKLRVMVVRTSQSRVLICLLVHISSLIPLFVLCLVIFAKIVQNFDFFEFGSTLTAYLGKRQVFLNRSSAFRVIRKA